VKRKHKKKFFPLTPLLFFSHVLYFSIALVAKVSVNEDMFEDSISIAVEKDVSTGRYRRSKDKSLRTIDSQMARGASVLVIYIHKSGPLQTRDVRHCYLRRYPESDGFNFDSAIASTVEDSLGDPGMDGTIRFISLKKHFSWNMKQRALITPSNDDGYFSALKFSRASSDDHDTSIGGFAALLSLARRHKPFGGDHVSGVFLIPLMKTPFKSRLIHSSLQAGFKSITSCESTLEIGGGMITACLRKENHFGHDTFVLDIVYDRSTNRSIPETRSLAQILPEIKIFDSQNYEVTPEY
jgi:hypothetical protein